MSEIHPTAILDDRVELADDVTIGPYCMLEGEIRIARGTRLMHHVTLQGPMTLGEDNTIYPYTVLGMAPQDLKYDPSHAGAGVVIGDRNMIRESVTIHRATGDEPTTIGNDNFFMANSHAAHDVRIDDHCVLVNGVLVGGHAHLADRVTIGGNGVVHQFCRIGRMAMISGVAGVTLDMPPFTLCYNVRTVSSLNIIGLRRAGYRDNIPALQRAFAILYHKSLNNDSAAQRIEEECGDDPLAMEFAQFVRSSTRGITSYAQRHRRGQTPS